MSVNVREMNCSPEAVFAVLADGWIFPTWVVGASRMRDVDDAWPAVGSKLQHSFGVWPLVIDDETTVLEYDPPRRMVIQPSASTAKTASGEQFISRTLTDMGSFSGSRGRGMARR